MDLILSNLLQAAQLMSPWEAAAVVLGIAYLLLAMRESLWCWYAAFASTSIFLVLFWNVSLVMESALQIYYLAMAVYGWWQWQHGTGDNRDLAISSLAVELARPGATSVASATRREAAAVGLRHAIAQGLTRRRGSDVPPRCDAAG